MIKELVAGVIYVMNRLITRNDMFQGVTPAMMIEGAGKMDASTKHIVLVVTLRYIGRLRITCKHEVFRRLLYAR